MPHVYHLSTYFKYFRIKILCPTTFVPESHMDFFAYVCSRYMIEANSESMYMLVYCETISYQTIDSVFEYLNGDGNIAICAGDWRSKLDLISSKSMWLTPATSSGILSKGFGKTTSYYNPRRLISLSSFRNKNYPPYEKYITYEEIQRQRSGFIV